MDYFLLNFDFGILLAKIKVEKPHKHITKPLAIIAALNKSCF